jgi:hypothetical protein
MVRLSPAGHVKEVLAVGADSVPNTVVPEDPSAIAVPFTVTVSANVPSVLVVPLLQVFQRFAVESAHR